MAVASTRLSAARSAAEGTGGFSRVPPGGVPWSAAVVLAGLAVAAASAWPLLAVLSGAAAVILPSLGLAAAALSVPFGSMATLGLGAGALTATPLLLVLATLGVAVRRIVSARSRPDAAVRPVAASYSSERASRGATSRTAAIAHPNGAGRAGGASTAGAIPRPWAACRPSAYLRAPAVVWALGTYILALGAAAWRAPDAARSAFEIARWVEMCLAISLVLVACRSRRSVAILLLAILVAGALASAWGVAGSLGRIGPESFAILGGRLYRAYGTFGQPNPFGGYVNMVWPVATALAISRWLPSRPDVRGRDGMPRGLAVAAAGAAVIALAGLGLSWSRGAWLAAAVGGSAMGLVWAVGQARSRGGAGRLTVILAAATIALLVGPGGARMPASIADRLGSVVDTFTVWGVADAEVDDASFATIERVAHWEAAAAMWADAPWLGQGPGHFEEAYARYRLPRWPDALGHAHNYYLHVAAEAGLVGLGAFLLLAAAAAGAALRAALAPRSALEAALGLGMVGVLAATAFHSLVDNLFVHDMTVHLGLLVGLLLALRRAGATRPAVH